MKKDLKSLLSIVLIISFMTMSSVNAANTVCTNWVVYRTVDNCDRSSGICKWNNWGNTNFRTDYKRKSCTNTSGRQFFEYTQTTYAHGCC